VPGVTAQVGFGSSLRVSLVQLLHGGLREAHRDSALAILVHGMALFGTATPHTHTGALITPRPSCLVTVPCACPLCLAVSPPQAKGGRWRTTCHCPRQPQQRAVREHSRQSAQPWPSSCMHSPWR
jgi:hypothetical protein